MIEIIIIKSQKICVCEKILQQLVQNTQNNRQWMQT